MAVGLAQAPSWTPILFWLWVAVLVAGLLVFRRWWLGSKGRLPPQPRVFLIVSLLAILLGSASIAGAIANHLARVEQDRIFMNTRIFTYYVSVNPNGTTPVRLLLPAPLDARVHSNLNQTNGTSTLKLNITGAAPSVEVLATGNVSFEIRVRFVGPRFDTTLSRVVVSDWAANVSIQLYGDGSGGSRAEASLLVEYYEYFCETTEFRLDALVREGIAEYPAVRWHVVC